MKPLTSGISFIIGVRKITMWIHHNSSMAPHTSLASQTAFSFMWGSENRSKNNAPHKTLTHKIK